MMMPYSREMLQQLKSKTDEDNRLHRISLIVNNIYKQVIQSASTTTNTSFKFDILNHYNHNNFANDLIDVCNNLQQLFPGCNIQCKTLSLNQDGKMCDVSTISEKLVPFINKIHDKSYILIDWS